MVDIPLQLTSGKNLLLDRLNGKSEIASLKLPENKLGKNLEILARNLRLEVNGKFEKVQRFNLFSNKDMREIRSFIASIDPSFNPLIEISDGNGRILQSKTLCQAKYPPKRPHSFSQRFRKTISRYRFAHFLCAFRSAALFIQKGSLPARMFSLTQCRLKSAKVMEERSAQR